MVLAIAKYDVVLTYSPIGEMTGHLFEVFDYYLFLRDYYSVGIVLMTGLSKDNIRIAFESKYSIPWEDVEQNIVLYNFTDFNSTRILSFDKDTVVILTDGNIYSLEKKKILLGCKKLLGFMCYDYNFHLMAQNKHIVYLQDYRIYGKHKYFNSFDYVKKLPFDKYKKINRVPENVGMMYITWVCRKVGKEIIEKYHIESGCDKTLLLVPDIIKEYEDIQNVEQVKIPVKDIMEKFDTYIYTPVERCFDCSSRLIVESFIYNKRVYLNVPYSDPALKVRYDDASNRLNDLNLTENDSILGIIKAYRR